MTLKDDQIATPAHLNRKRASESAKQEETKEKKILDQWVELTMPTERSKPAKVILCTQMSSGHLHRSYQGKMYTDPAKAAESPGNRAVNEFKAKKKYFPNGKPQKEE